MTRRHAIATAVLAAVALCLYWWSRPPEAPDDRSAAETGAALHTGAPGADGTRAAVARRDGGVQVSAHHPGARMPASLRGTEVDGWLTVDANGQFVADEHALRLFDYLLSTEGEITAAEIRALVEAQALARVPSDQVQRVLELFDDYMLYRRESKRATRSHDPAKLQDYLDDLKATQRKIFGDEAAERMFGASNRLAQDSISRGQILQDESLSDKERNDKLADLDNKLSARVRQMREKIAKPANARQTVKQMRADGVPEEEIDAYRADEFGEEAATRLRTLDKQRSAWSDRMNGYRSERDAIKARGLGEGATEVAIQELREELFKGAEVTRVRVLDKMERDQATAPP